MRRTFVREHRLKQQPINTYCKTCYTSLQSSIISILLLFTLSFSLTGQEKKFQHFTTIEGLSYNTVFDIVQDKNGFMWVATGEGLNRYDSYGFITYYTNKSEHSIPSNDVRTLLVTRGGELFVGTTEGLCLFNPEHDNFNRIQYEGKSLGYIYDILETSKSKVMITSETGVYYSTQNGEIKERLPLERAMLGLAEDSLGNFWCYKRQRLFKFDEKGRVLKVFYVNPNGLPQNIPSSISTISIDSKNRLWIGTFRDGPVLLPAKNVHFRKIPMNVPPGKTHPMYFIRTVLETPEGKYWIGTEKGLFIYDIKQGTYEHYSQSFDASLASINDNAIYKIFRSRENIMWIGTYFGGLNFHESVSSGFKKIKPGINSGELKGKALSQIKKLPNENLLIATEDAGIAIFNPKDFTFRHILNDQKPNTRQNSNNVHALAIDREGNIWSGNFYGGVNKINPSNFQVSNFSHIPGNQESLINNFVFSLYFDSIDRLWVGTMDGVDLFDKKTERFLRFKPGIFRGRFIYDIFQDQQLNFWFCTNDNSGLFRYNPATDEVKHFQKDSFPNLHSNSFVCHHIDSRGKLWFGSRGGGLVMFDSKSENFTSYTMEDGLPNNVIYGILEDEWQNLWLSTNKGISKFNYITGEIRNFTVDHGLVGNQFNYKSYYKNDDGTMYFGAVNGLTYFHPSQIKTYESEPEIHFSSFRLFNKPVKPGEKSILKKHIDLTEQITLKYHQNVISFDFVALDFHSRGKNNFYYYMDGFESTWQSSGKNQSVTYTNLPPGDYTFRIKATNIYNFPNQQERNLKITILPPIWRTPMAYIAYAFLLAMTIFLLYRFNEIRHRERTALKIEKFEKEKLRELHQHKINFFTYISHEFKTPLTIILASLDTFFNGNKLPAPYANRLISVKRNVVRLQFLINQLMDFRKIETDHAVFNLKYGNVIHFSRELFNAFSYLFTKKKLEYIFISPQENLYIQFDPDKFEKIISNLLTNAFKFTPAHGQIKFQVDTIMEDEKDLIRFIVSDTGTGMTNEQIENVFNLFYKIENEQNDYQGSGIGLTLTQSLVKFLNGSIEIKSKLGEGTSFIVKLPYVAMKAPDGAVDDIHLNKSTIENLMIQSTQDDNLLIENEVAKSEFEIYFVEDNKELLKFLCDHFKGKYKINAFSNGLEAWKQVQKNIPDLVVTDLMMPQMDGVALCKKLKSNFEYCHIPVIMLTAKSDINTRIESLEMGADIYMPKPFLLSELELQIKNLLTAKANLKKHFIKFGKLEIEHPLKNKDQQFIEKVTAVIHKNIDQPDFGISKLTDELGVGRTLLHTKLKLILDLSATEFINTIRIREAQKILLENPDFTMSEVAYKVGFNDPNYFSRTFKKILKISPSDFKTKKIKKPQPC